MTRRRISFPESDGALLHLTGQSRLCCCRTHPQWPSLCRSVHALLQLHWHHRNVHTFRWTSSRLASPHHRGPAASPCRWNFRLHTSNSTHSPRPMPMVTTRRWPATTRSSVFRDLQVLASSSAAPSITPPWPWPQATQSIMTHSAVPMFLPHGHYELVVIANGIASEPVRVHVGPEEKHEHEHHENHHENGRDRDDDGNLTLRLKLPVSIEH